MPGFKPPPSMRITYSMPEAAGRNSGAPGFVLPVGGVRLEDLEREFVIQALDRCSGNQTRAAGLLGLNRDQIRYRLEKFGLRK